MESYIEPEEILPLIPDPIVVETLYSERDLVYVKQQSLKGKLQKVVVKRIITNDRGGVNYIDTMNGIWLEEELILYPEALANMESYIEPEETLPLIPDPIVVETLYSERDLVYVKKQSLKGKLQKVVIKRIVVNDRVEVNYIDTMNGIWLEEELILYPEALDNVESYIATEKIKLHDYLDSKC